MTGLDKLQKLLFGEIEPAPKKGHKTPEPPKEKPKYFQKGLITLISLTFLTGFYYASAVYYPHTDTRMLKNKYTIDLTDQDFKMKYHIGNLPSCYKNSNCWASPNYNDSKWQEHKFPTGSIEDLEGYKGYKEKQFLYYRGKIKVPSKLINQKYEISFTPMYVRHGFFQIFINGRLVISNNSYRSTAPIILVDIPKHDIVNNTVTVGIKGSLSDKNLDAGIFHRGRFYIGPSYILQSLYIHKERATATFYLLTLLSKGGIFIVFALIFLFTTGQKGFFNFLIFAFCSTTESLLIGNFTDQFFTIPERIILIFYLKVGALIGLFGFIAYYFSVKNAHKKQLYFSGILLSLITLGLILQRTGFDNNRVSVITLFNFTNTVLVGLLIASIILGRIGVNMWLKLNIEPHKLRPYKNLIIANFIYLAALIWEFYLKGQYSGFDLRPVYDTFFFLYIAFETIREFGFTKKRVLNLETHMEEKLRMEQELQDAAEISKVFVPSTPPKLKDIKIATYYKPLSENGGDWYTFEESNSQNYLYFFMCDVTGHGVQAAIIVSTCRTILTSHMHHAKDRDEGVLFAKNYITDLNKTLYTQGDGKHVTTICSLVFDRKNKKVFYMSGGHPFPILIRNGDLKKESLEVLINRQTVLGNNLEYEFEFQSTEFKNKDEIIIFTDGVSVHSNIRNFKKNLPLMGEDFYAHPKKIIDLSHQLERDRGKEPEEDDLTVVCFKSSF